MDCDGWNMFRDTRPQGDDSGDVGCLRRLANAAKNHFVNQRRIETGPGEQGIDGNSPELISAHLSEFSAHFAEGRAHAIDNDKTRGIHGFASRSASAARAADEETVVVDRASVGDG